MVNDGWLSSNWVDKMHRTRQPRINTTRQYRPRFHVPIIPDQTVPGGRGRGTMGSLVRVPSLPSPPQTGTGENITPLDRTYPTLPLHLIRITDTCENITLGNDIVAHDISKN